MSIDEYPQGGGYDPRIVTSGGRPSNPYPGLMIYELDTKVTYIWDGTNWSPIGGLKKYCKSTALGAGTNTTTSFQDVPGPIDLAFTKRASHTALAVWGSMTHYASANPGLTAHAVRINGIDYSIGDFFFNTMSEHANIGFGNIVAAGLAAGDYTARLRWRSVGSVNLNCDTNDVALFYIEEVLP